MAEITRVHRPFQRHNKEIYLFLLCSVSSMFSFFSLFMLEPRQSQSRVVSGDGPDKGQEKMKVPVPDRSLTGWLTLEKMFNFMGSHCLPLKMRNKRGGSGSWNLEVSYGTSILWLYKFKIYGFSQLQNKEHFYLFKETDSTLFILQSHIFRGWSWDYKSPDTQSQSICY